MAMNKCGACGAFNPASRSSCFKCKSDFGTAPGGGSSTPPAGDSGTPPKRASSLTARESQDHPADESGRQGIASRTAPQKSGHGIGSSRFRRKTVENADELDGGQDFDDIEVPADPAEGGPLKLHLAGKVIDGHRSKFASPDDMIEKVICPSGSYCVSECNSSVNEHLKLDKKFLYSLLAVIVLSALGGDLVDLVIGVYLMWLFGAAAIAFIKGMRIIPDAAVLHGKTLTVFHGVLRNRSTGTTSYAVAYHFPVKSVKRVWLLSWFQFTFKAAAPHASVTLTKIRYFLPWTKNKYYTKKIIPLKEMKAKVL